MKRISYRIVIMLMFLMGLLHCSLMFVGLRRFSGNAYWFLGTGLALILYSALNFVYIQHRERHETKYIVYAANLLMLLFVCLSFPVLGIAGNPQLFVLLVLSVLMLLFSILSGQRIRA